MSYITRGYTLTDGLLNDYTSTHLHQLVDSATVTAIPLSEFSTAAHVLQVAASVPSSDQGDGSLWYDTALGLLRVKNANARWDCQYVGPWMRNPDVTIPRGAWVTVSADNDVLMCATLMWPEVLGVALTTLVSGASGMIACKNYGATLMALLIGPVTIGDVLISAGHSAFAFTDGYARSLHAPLPTAATTVTLGIAIGMALASVASGVTALGNVVIWR